jgi:hypothetical protein
MPLLIGLVSIGWAYRRRRTPGAPARQGAEQATEPTREPTDDA